MLWARDRDGAAGGDGAWPPAVPLPGLQAAIQRAQRRRAGPDLPAQRRDRLRVSQSNRGLPAGPGADKPQRPTRAGTIAASRAGSDARGFESDGAAHRVCRDTGPPGLSPPRSPSRPACLRLSPPLPGKQRPCGARDHAERVVRRAATTNVRNPDARDGRTARCTVDRGSGSTTAANRKLWSPTAWSPHPSHRTRSSFPCSPATVTGDATSALRRPLDPLLARELTERSQRDRIRLLRQFDPPKMFLSHWKSCRPCDTADVRQEQPEHQGPLAFEPVWCCSWSNDFGGQPDADNG